MKLRKMYGQKNSNEEQQNLALQIDKDCCLSSLVVPLLELAVEEENDLEPHGLNYSCAQFWAALAVENSTNHEISG